MMESFKKKLKESDSRFSKFLFKILLIFYENILGSQLLHSIYDYIRYAIHGSGPFLSTQGKLDSYLIKEYHKIEKGLTLDDFRPLFGKRTVEGIIKKSQSYVKKYGLNDTVIICVNVLRSYLGHHQKLGINDLFLVRVREKLDTFITNYNINEKLGTEGGYKNISKSSLLKNGVSDIELFFSSRSSVRSFSSDPVDIELIKKAIQISIKTPSVCNRQPWRVYLLTDKIVINKVLSYQNGNASFRKTIDKLLIVVSDLNSFHGGVERYQPWIDGGMFSMSLVMALHGLGIGSCCLNWSSFIKNDLGLRKILKLKKSHSIVMMIAVGNIPDHLKITDSPRKKLSNILEILS